MRAIKKERLQKKKFFALTLFFFFFFLRGFRYPHKKKRIVLPLLAQPSHAHTRVFFLARAPLGARGQGKKAHADAHGG